MQWADFEKQSHILSLNMYSSDTIYNNSEYSTWMIHLNICTCRTYCKEAERALCIMLLRHWRVIDRTLKSLLLNISIDSNGLTLNLSCLIIPHL